MLRIRGTLTDRIDAFIRHTKCQCHETSHSWDRIHFIEGRVNRLLLVTCLKTMVLTRLANQSSTPKVALVVYASIMLSVMGSTFLVRSVLEQ